MHYHDEFSSLRAMLRFLTMAARRGKDSLH
jgi:hypothetical protein